MDAISSVARNHKLLWKSYFGKFICSKWLPCSILTNYCPSNVLYAIISLALSLPPTIYSYRKASLQWAVSVCWIPVKTMYYSTNASFIGLTCSSRTNKTDHIYHTTHSPAHMYINAWKFAFDIFIVIVNGVQMLSNQCVQCTCLFNSSSFFCSVVQLFGVECRVRTKLKTLTNNLK